MTAIDFKDKNGKVERKQKRKHNFFDKNKSIKYLIQF
jgi:hypothetical protein